MVKNFSGQICHLVKLFSLETVLVAGALEDI